MSNYRRRRKFSKVYDDYVDKIYRFVFLKTGTKEIAEDLTAQVFSKGWKKFKTGPKIKNVSAYLYQIARAEIADYYRKKSKFKIISTESVQIVDPKATAEQDQELMSDIETIRTGLSRLSANYQNILVWRYIEGLSIKEIAKMLGKEPGAVRVMIHRALKEMKKQM